MFIEIQDIQNKEMQHINPLCIARIYNYDGMNNAIELSNGIDIVTNKSISEMDN